MRKGFAVLLTLACTAGWAQDFDMRLFPRMELAHSGESLSTEALQEVCAAYPDNFNQPLFTYGSEDQSDWALVGDMVVKYPQIVEPVGHIPDLDADGRKDLVISFMAGYEYTFVAFYQATDQGYRFLGSGTGTYFGRREDGGLWFKRKACCSDPTHEFYKMERSGNGMLNVTDSLSVVIGYASQYPQWEENEAHSEWTRIESPRDAISNSGKTFAQLPAGTEVRKIKQIEGDGRILWFAEIRWKGDARLFPHAYVWLGEPL